MGTEEKTTNVRAGTYSMGDRVRLSQTGRAAFSNSRRLDRVGKITKDLGNYTVYVLWDDTQKTPQCLHRSFVEASLDGE